MVRYCTYELSFVTNAGSTRYYTGYALNDGHEREHNYIQGTRIPWWLRRDGYQNLSFRTTAANIQCKAAALATEALFAAWRWRTHPDETRGGAWLLAGLSDRDKTELREAGGCKDVEALIRLAKEPRHKGGHLWKHLHDLSYAPEKASRPPASGSSPRVLRRVFKQHMLTGVQPKSRSGSSGTRGYPGGRTKLSGRRPPSTRRVMKVMKRRSKSPGTVSGAQYRKALQQDGKLKQGEAAELRLHWGSKPHQEMADSWSRRTPVSRAMRSTKAMKSMKAMRAMKARG